MAMQAWAYPAVFEVSPGEVVVTFPDIEEAITGSETLEEARILAADALEEAILGRLAHAEAIPAPRRARAGEELVPLDPVTAARAALSVAMRQEKLSNAALARRLGRTEGAVRRLTSGQSGVKLDTVLQALGAVGKRGVFATV